MAKRDGGNVGSKHHGASSCPLATNASKLLKDVCSKKKSNKLSETKEWDDTTCPVCMEYPHNAVLLLCSSYHKGCRPYLCATSHHHSNCLKQYKKAYKKVSEIRSTQEEHGSEDSSGSSSLEFHQDEKKEAVELVCPLCRGQVKGWTVVKQARKYFNSKERTCMHDSCSFVGDFKQLKKHVRAEHPRARPRAVDPAREEEWKRLEDKRERDDVISTIESSTPGAVVVGDYVIEPPHHRRVRGYDRDDYVGERFFFSGFRSFGRSGRYPNIYDRVFGPLEEEEDDSDTSGSETAHVAADSVRGFRRFLFERSRRWRGHREH